MDSKNMTIWQKYLSQIVLVAALFAFSQLSQAQTAFDADSDILDFIPAIIAAAQQKQQVPTPPISEPPVTGVGNLRIAKTEIFNRLTPTGRVSEFISGWDSSGNNVRDDLTIFDLFGGNPSQIRQTVAADTSFDDYNRPLTRNYTTAYANGNQELGIQQYHYQNGRLHSTSSESTFTSTITGSITTNSNTIFKYAVNNRLIGATVTISQPDNNIISTEQHTPSYDSNNRINAHRVVRTNNITNTPDETLHTHRYDSAGNLIESITITSTNVKATWTYPSIVGNNSTGSIVAIDQSTGTVLSDSILVGTLETGICTLRGPNDPYTIEANITASRPYSPNGGCIKR